MTRVVVHIACLALDGMPRPDRHAIADALKRELRHRMADLEVLRQWTDRGDAVRFDAGRVIIPSGLPAHAIGVRLARSVAGVRRR